MAERPSSTDTLFGDGWISYVGDDWSGANLRFGVMRSKLPAVQGLNEALAVPQCLRLVQKSGCGIVTSGVIRAMPGLKASFAVEGVKATSIPSSQVRDSVLESEIQRAVQESGMSRLEAIEELAVEGANAREAVRKIEQARREIAEATLGAGREIDADYLTSDEAYEAVRSGRFDDDEG